LVAVDLETLVTVVAEDVMFVFEAVALSKLCTNNVNFSDSKPPFESISSAFANEHRIDMTTTRKQRVFILVVN
jgi:hypothetical protein